MSGQQDRGAAGAPWKQWGLDLEEGAVAQMRGACGLPVAVAGALMPDAHQGYGLPIGGVLATENAVVPYAVGVDIACRMRLSVVDLAPDQLSHQHVREKLIAAIERETCFGVGGALARREQHGVLDDDWTVSPVTGRLKDKAWSQLGTSGSGNHFVEWGVLTVTAHDTALESRATQTLGGSGWDWNLAPGEYLALLSHSGSRGTGAAVCDHYSKLAMRLRPDLPKDQRYLAWLDMDTQEGREYWDAMNLMGRYASANHETIHKRVLRHLGVRALAYVENHHNFAWQEEHWFDAQGRLVDVPADADAARAAGFTLRSLIVHRKGATPAGAGVMGVIPGSMATPGFVVRGKGSGVSMNSASHGAGRVMSRTKAREKFRWGNVRREVEAQGVQVLSAGIDEVPGVYKDIHTVMAAQHDLVEVVARFDPKIVKMAPEGEKAED